MEGRTLSEEKAILQTNGMPTTEDGPVQMRVLNLVKNFPVKSGALTLKPEIAHAVADVNFDLIKGETLGLVGESGSGKSTIGRLLVALDKPDSGSILYDGVDIVTASKQEIRSIRTELQMIFQDSSASLNPRKHIYEILAAPLLYHKLETRQSVEKRIDELLDMVGLPRNSKARYAHEFSGGQRQRIGIAKALSLNPRIIVCDEPVSALDVSIQAQILNLLLELQEELDLTYLFIAHGLAAVNYVSDRIAVMYLGRIVEITSAEELFKCPMHPYTMALIKSSPIAKPAARDTRTQLLEGEMPSNITPPSGCAFHPRCPYVEPSCITDIPKLEHIRTCSKSGKKHLLACPVMARRRPLLGAVDTDLGGAHEK